MSHSLVADGVTLEDLRFVEAVARAAGAAALEYYGLAVAEMKAGNSPVTQADHAANDVIIARLAAAFPKDAILSEESADSRDRLDARRVWIVDPLDGTKEFLAQNGEFAIMIGLAVGGRPVLGVVYRPDGDVMYSALEGEGAWVERDGERTRLRCQPVEPAAIRLVGSRSHPDSLLVRIQSDLKITDVAPSGSVGVKCSLIAEGLRDLYVHPVAYLNEWDTCGPEVLLREAGGHVSDCNGEPLRYNKAHPVQPHGIIATGQLADTQIVERIAAIYRDRTVAA